MRKNNGITLMALVITIIILIILAGISISLLMGEDGLITKAKQGAQNYQNAMLEEQERLNTLYSDFESQSTVIGTYDAVANLMNFKRTIATAITNAGVTTSENDDAETMADNIAEIYNLGVAAGEENAQNSTDNQVEYVRYSTTPTGNATVTINDLQIGDVIVLSGYGTYTGSNFSYTGMELLYTNMVSYASCHVLKVTDSTITYATHNRTPICLVFRKESGDINCEVVKRENLGAVYTFNETCNKGDIIVYARGDKNLGDVSVTGTENIYKNTDIITYVGRALADNSPTCQFGNATTWTVRLY